MRTQLWKQPGVQKTGSDSPWPRQTLLRSQPGQEGTAPAKRNGFSMETSPQLLLPLLHFLMLGAGTPHSPLTGGTWVKPNSAINYCFAVPEHDSSPNFYFLPFKNQKAELEADVAVSADQEATLLRNRNPGFLEQV